jgi:predicted dehydrogenase
MAVNRLGIIMHGVTGRMGYNQHLVRSILAIRDQGGVTLASGDKVMPDPILVGRNEDKLAEIARKHGISRHTTNLDQALGNKEDMLFFDAGSTQMRADLLTKAINAGKMIYCEKPVADSLTDAIKVARLARQKSIKTGVVQDKLFLPGLRKMKLLKDAGSSAACSPCAVSSAIVFEGDPADPAAELNYRKAEGGGIILNMLCHWRYVLDNLP